MCGIAGILRSTFSEEQSLSELRKMLDAIKHRGPDASGIFNIDNNYIGHNRLSIIDLDKRSDQPFRYNDLVLTYNGEIYNYLEIKNELEKLGHQFKTNSDTEVLIHAYDHWGKECLDRFIGMWAFVILNTTTGDVFGARDRFGIKPFYYMHSGSFHFASEIKALRTCHSFDSALNDAQLARYLQLGWIECHEETFYKNVKSLPAAHCFSMRNEKFTVERYYDIDLQTKLDGRTWSDKCHMFNELFHSSIKYHLISDVSVATCLSGGIDSSAIVSAASSLYPDRSYNSYSIYYSGESEVDERPFINAVLSKYENINGRFYEPKIDEVKEHFDQALSIQDVPPPSSSFISQYFLMKMISNDNIKVVLDGQGSDEYLAGYMHSFYRLVADNLRKLNFKQAINELRQSNRNREGGSLIGESIKSLLSLIFEESTLYNLEYRFYEPMFTTHPGVPELGVRDTNAGSLDNFLYNLIYTTSLPNLLHFEDHNSMAFSIESRVPFLDHRLVELGFMLSNSDKIYNGVTKRILRESLREVLPHEVYTRKDKKGFVTPRYNISDFGNNMKGEYKGGYSNLFTTNVLSVGDWKNETLLFWIFKLN